MTDKVTGGDSEVRPVALTPATAYALVLAVVQVDGDGFEGFEADADGYEVHPNGVMSWCFSTPDMAPGSFFAHVHGDGSVTFSAAPYEDEANGCVVVVNWPDEPTAEVARGAFVGHAEARRELARRALAGDQWARFAMSTRRRVKAHR